MALARKDIGTGWDRNNRNAINDNFKELYEEFRDAGLDAKEAMELAKRSHEHSDRISKELGNIVAEGDSSPLTSQLSVGASGIEYNDPQNRFVKEYDTISKEMSRKRDKNTKINKGDYDLSKNSNLWNVNDFDEDTRKALLEANQIDVNYVLGRGSVKNDNIADGAVDINNLSFVDNPVNLFSGKYVPIHLTGDKNVPMTVVDTNKNARSIIIEVKPNTSYTVSKEKSDRFRIGLFKEYPEVGTKINEYIKDEHASVEAKEEFYTFHSGENEYAVIFVSRQKEEPKIYVIEGTDSYDFEVNEEKISSKYISLGKNIFNGEYIKGTIRGEVDSLGYLTEGDGLVAVVNVKPNTTYTISKTKSNRTKLGLSQGYPMVNTPGVPGNIKVLFDDNTGDTKAYTFTTGEFDRYLSAYLSFEDIPPDFVQVEESSKKTEWESYGYKINPLAKTINDNKKLEFNTSLEEFGAIGDGVTDDTESIRKAFLESKGKKILIPRGKTYVITGTVYLESDTVLEGMGETSRFILGNDYKLDSVNWRSGKVYPVIATKKNSKNIKMKNFRYTGNKEQFTDQRQLGIGIIDSENVVIEDVIAEYNNYFPSQNGTGSGWTLGILRSKFIDVLRGKYDFSGYENFGSEDSEEINVINSYFGTGWRTSFQIHRGTKNIRLDGVTIDQDSEHAHSALTMHGTTGVPVDGVFINNLKLKSLTDTSQVKRGGIQTVEGVENNVVLTNSSIDVNNQAVYTSSDKDSLVENWKLIGNTFKGNKGINLNVNNALVKDNIINVDKEAVTGNGDYIVARDNILVNNKDISVEGEHSIVKDNL